MIQGLKDYRQSDSLSFFSVSCGWYRAQTLLFILELAEHCSGMQPQEFIPPMTDAKIIAMKMSDPKGATP